MGENFGRRSEISKKSQEQFSNLDSLKKEIPDGVENNREYAMRQSTVPNGIATVPIQWFHPNGITNLVGYVGWSGYRVDEGKYLRPVLGWALDKTGTEKRTKRP